MQTRIKPLELDPKYSVGLVPVAPGVDELRVFKTATGEHVPLDEPLILFRARDHNALDGALRPYQRLCKRDHCTDFHMAGIINRIAAFWKFKNEHPERMKQPGITRGL